LRPLSGIGYTFGLRRRDFDQVARALAVYTLVGIPLGLITRFLVLRVASFDLESWVLAWPLGYVFTALPEEMLFRGIIQNQIHDRINTEKVALTIAALIFGLAHLNNATPGYPVPNWMYAIMASLAGLAYGWTWRKTGKITASAVVHATVNYVWGILLGG
jgi:membrane protease YdiL (CAAX protease family)